MIRLQSIDSAHEIRICGSLGYVYPNVNAGSIEGMASRASTEFAQRMRQARIDAGMSRRQVQEAVKIAASTMHDIETIAIGSKHTAVIAALYGVSAAWLATGKGEMGRSARPSYSMRKLMAIYRALDPDMQSVLVDSARALHRHKRRTKARVDAASAEQTAPLGRRPA